MDKVIITVRQYSKEQWFDVELPTSVPVGEIANRLVATLGWEQGDPFPYELEVDPPGRLLLGSETLEQAGVWDGAWLVFHKKGETLPAFPTQTHISLPKTEQKPARNKAQPAPVKRTPAPLPRPLPDLPSEPIKYQREDKNLVVQEALPVSVTPKQTEKNSPVTGWRSLEIPAKENEAHEEEPRESKYSWKRLDE